MDYGKVLDEQGNVIAGGTSTLMQFQENAKRLSAATQSLETGFYSMLGALGGEGTDSVVSSIGEMSDNFVRGTSDFTKAMLYGTKTIAGLGLNLLKNTLPTYMAVYKGTLHGTTQAGMFGGGMAGRLGKGAGRMAGGIGRALPYVGALATAGMSIKGLTDDDKSNDRSSKWGIAGSVAGGIIGGLIGGIPTGGIGAMPGAAWGAMIGGQLGATIGGMTSSRAGGTMGAIGQRFEPENILTTVDKGETVLNQADAKTFANLNFDGMEKQLAVIAAGQATANKIHSQHLDQVNTGIMIQNKTRIATETTARKDRNQVGLIS
jgi:hypothetical protein